MGAGALSGEILYRGGDREGGVAELRKATVVEDALGGALADRVEARAHGLPDRLEERRRPDQIGVLLPAGRIGIASVRASGSRRQPCCRNGPCTRTFR